MKFKRLVEAIGVNDSVMAIKAIQSYLERKLDQKLNRLKFNRISNKGMNVIFTNTHDAGAIKFNFEIESTDVNYVKKDSIGCTSIDIYSPAKVTNELGMIERPTATIQIPNGLSFVKILPKLVDVIKNPSPRSFTIYKLNIDGEEELIVETGVRVAFEIDGIQYQTKGEAFRALRAHGMKIKDVLKKIKKATGEDIVEEVTEVTVEKGKADIEDSSLVQAQTKKLQELAESLMNDIEYKTPVEMFKDIEDRIDDLMKPESGNRSLVVTGMGGIGKTYTITNHLKVSKIDYANGAEVPSVVALYKLLFMNKGEGRILLFDDCDAVVRNPETQNLLKLALDTSVNPVSYFASRGIFNIEIDRKLSPADMNKKLDREFLVRNAIALGFVDEDSESDAEEDGPVDLELSPSDLDEIEDSIYSTDSYTTSLDKMGDKLSNKNLKTESVLTEKKNKMTRDQLEKQAVLNPEFSELWNSKAPIDIGALINKKGASISELVFPAKFYYRGKMIFVSNMDQSKWPAPLSSRAFKVNIWLTSTEVLDLIKSIMPTVSPQYSMEVKKRAFEVFEKNIEKIDAWFKVKFPGNTAYFNLRSYTKALDIASNMDLNGKVLEVQILRFCLA